jgi:hypothetical protein
MFFRRERPQPVTFEKRLDMLRSAGFSLESRDGRVRIIRENCGAEIENIPGQSPRIVRIGMLVDATIATLVDCGFQKFFETPRGDRLPALASDLKALQNFKEDLVEALGLVSLYNESLGTVCNRHIYDRLTGRP